MSASRHFETSTNVRCPGRLGVKPDIRQRSPNNRDLSVRALVQWRARIVRTPAARRQARARKRRARRQPIRRSSLLAEGPHVSRSILNGPGWHENAADDRRLACAVKPRRLYLLFRAHAIHVFVYSRADLENALRSTATVIEQNDHVGPLRELDGGSLARVGVAAHGLDDLDRCFAPAYSLDDFSENFGVAGDLTHQRNGPALFVGQTVDLVGPLDHVAPAPVIIGYLVRDAAMMIVFRAHDRDIESLFGEPLYHAIELFDEGADQIVEQIDTARDQGLLRLLVKSVKPEHQAIAPAQG